MTAPTTAEWSAGVDVLLSDGRIAVVRPVLGSDEDALVRLHEQVADESLRKRFFGVNRAEGRRYAVHLAAGAGSPSVLGLVVLLDDVVVAVASAEVLVDGRAEVSFLVSDAAHGSGLGTLLLEHLAARARDRGITEFTADVLADNQGMIAVLMDGGFDSSAAPSTVWSPSAWARRPPSAPWPPRTPARPGPRPGPWPACCDQPAWRWWACDARAAAWGERSSRSSWRAASRATSTSSTAASSTSRAPAWCRISPRSARRWTSSWWPCPRRR